MSSSDTDGHNDFFQSLLGDFLGESEQLLHSLNKNLLRLDEWIHSIKDEQDPPCADNLLGKLFRAAHSLKGLANMLGLDEIERLLLSIEQVFDAARKDQITVTDDVITLMFEAIDRLGNLIDALKDLDRPAVEFESTIEQIDKLLESPRSQKEPRLEDRAEHTLTQIESHVADALKENASKPSEPDTTAEPSGIHGPTSSATKEKANEKKTESPSPASEPSGPDDNGPLFLEQQSKADAEAETKTDSQIESFITELFAELSDDADMSSRFISIFIDETEMALDQLTETLLALEKGGTHDELKNLLVVSHRIKGSAASIGLNRCAKLAHLMEDLLQDLTNTGRRLSPEVTDALLKCMDALRQYVEGLKQGSIPEDLFPPLAIELTHARQKAARTSNDSLSEAGVAQKTALAKADSDGSSQGMAESETQERLLPISQQLREQVSAAAPIGIPVFLGVVTFQSDLPLVALKAELIYEKLCSLGEVCYYDPAPEQFDTIEKLDCVRFGLATERSEEPIRRALKTAGVVGAIIETLFYAADDTAYADSTRDTRDATTVPSGSPGAQAGPATTLKSVSESTGSPAAPSAAAPPKSQLPDKSRRPTETLRVDIDRLDQLMNLAGQLVVNKARFSQINDRMRSAFHGKRSVLATSNILEALARLADIDVETADREALETEIEAICMSARQIQNQLEPMHREVESFRVIHNSIEEFEEAVHQLERVADEIQKNVMDTRMVPIGPLFTRFHRVIRDITRASGKSMQLIIEGENTELDKRMIDELGDPLIHMIRNSADHGIESPEVRLKAGKPAEGTVMLSACHRGNNILIQISDDGQGLVPDRILAKALEKGVVTPAEAERMTTHQIFQLIWHPGLSTARVVTDVSGRGMGMDIVKSKVDALSGTVELDSTPGKGTTITIKLPLTLAILPSLMVNIGGDVFAMPMESVSEIVSVCEREIATVHGKWTAQIRGRVVSIVRLDEVFDWNESASPPAGPSNKELTLVIVAEDNREIGLVVNHVIGEEDVVIKSMADNYRHVPGIAGASVLGDGRVSLILDLAAVIDMAARANAPVLVS